VCDRLNRFLGVLCQLIGLIVNCLIGALGSCLFVVCCLVGFWLCVYWCSFLFFVGFTFLKFFCQYTLYFCLVVLVCFQGGTVGGSWGKVILRVVCFLFVRGLGDAESCLSCC
jgi:hypothetical protein